MSNNTSQVSNAMEDNVNSSKQTSPKSLVVETKSSMFNMPKNARRPNVFTTAPRPGGYLQTLNEEKVAELTTINNALGIHYTPPKPSPRDQLIAGFHHLDNWVAASKNESVDPCDSRTEEARRKDRDLSLMIASLVKDDEDSVDSWSGLKSLPQDCNYVMAIAISTVMAFAANPSSRPPENHILWTINFLSTIKDDNNKTPINLLGIKRLFRPLLKGMQVEDFLLEDFKKDAADLNRSMEAAKAREQTKPSPKSPPAETSHKTKASIKSPTPTPTPTPAPSQQSALTATGAVPKGKATSKKASAESGETGSRNSSRKSSWK